MTERPLIPAQLLCDFEPQRSWLSHESYLHGVGHLTRVFILQELICTQLEQEGTTLDRQAVRFGAMAHDVGRLDDGPDLQHGTRSAAWIHEHLADKMSPATLDTATYIVHWHVPSDSEAPVMTPELQALKDADALDRVRLGDLNPNYLRTKAALGLIETAEQLYQLSVDLDVTYTEGTFASTMKAAQILEIVEKE